MLLPFEKKKKKCEDILCFMWRVQLTTLTPSLSSLSLLPSFLFFFQTLTYSYFRPYPTHTKKNLKIFHFPKYHFSSPSIPNYIPFDTFLFKWWAWIRLVIVYIWKISLLSNYSSSSVYNKLSFPYSINHPFNV